MILVYVYMNYINFNDHKLNTQLVPDILHWR